MSDEPSVWVRRQWNDWRKARYGLSDVTGPHWDSLSGGVQDRRLSPSFTSTCGAMQQSKGNSLTPASTAKAHTGSRCPSSRRTTVEA